MTEKEKIMDILSKVKMTKTAKMMTAECITTSEVARQFGMTSREMYQWLEEMGVIYYSKLHHCYRLGVSEEGGRLMDYRLYLYLCRDGMFQLKRYPVWTPAGVEVIRTLWQGGKEE